MDNIKAFLVVFAVLMLGISVGSMHQKNYKKSDFNIKLCNAAFGIGYKSISIQPAKDIPHKGRKPNTITIICEEE